MFITDIAIRRPVTTFMMMLALVVFGVVGYVRLGVDQYPDVDFPVVTVTTIFEGASPDVVEENVTDVIEEEITTIEGIRKLSSISSHGASVIMIEFDLERDIDLASQDVRDRINRVMRRLPQDVEIPSVDKFDLQAQPIMWIAVSGSKPIYEVTAYAEDVLKTRLEGIKGVGSIIVGGKQDRTIRIWLDRKRLEKRGITVHDVVDALRRENVDIPGGFMESREIEFTVKTEGEFPGVESFNELIIVNRNGFPVRLKDVGYVEDGIEDIRTIARYNGTPAVGLGIRKRAGANTVEVAGLVKEEIEKIKTELPDGIELDVAFDASVFVEEAIEEMKFALVFGGLLAGVIVFVFLRHISATLITAVTIPLSITATFFFIYLFGFTINTMTMLALTLSIGVVIDDAIIILENIYRHRERGEGDVEGASRGTKEIAFAALASTSAIASVFIPVAFMKGVVGRFFYEFGTTVSVAIFISLFVALTLTPMLCSRFLRIGRDRSRFFDASERVYRGMEAYYRKVLTFCLSHRVPVVVLAIMVFGWSLFIWQRLGKEFVPSEDQSRFMIRFETPVGSSIDYTDNKLRKAEAYLKGLPEIRSFFSAIGLGEAGRVNKGLVFVRMHPAEQRGRSQQEIIGIVREVLNMEPDLRAFVEPLVFGFGSRRGPPLEFIIMGPDVDGLRDLSSMIVERFATVPGIVDVDTDLEIGLPELRVRIDRTSASELGVDTTKIASTINLLIGGQDVTTYKEGGRRYDVRIKLIPGQRRVPEDILSLSVRGRDGRLIRLANVATIEEGLGPSAINRLDRRRSVTISANLDGGKTLASAIEDISRIAEEVLPSGYTSTLGGQAELFREAMKSLMTALLLAVIITYMVLASQFESFIHPFTVMMSLPLSIVGALGGLYITGNTINIYSLIGLILLVGLVTKNSILLVDYTNTLRGSGAQREMAVVDAGSARLRPILMTAFSTIFGVLPTALGIGPGSESRVPMAVATIGGMLTSTFLTLLVVPVVYTLIDDLGRIFWGRRPI